MCAAELIDAALPVAGINEAGSCKKSGGATRPFLEVSHESR